MTLCTEGQFDLQVMGQRVAQNRPCCHGDSPSHVPHCRPLCVQAHEESRSNISARALVAAFTSGRLRQRRSKSFPTGIENETHVLFFREFQ